MKPTQMHYYKGNTSNLPYICIKFDPPKMDPIFFFMTPAPPPQKKNTLTCFCVFFSNQRLLLETNILDKRRPVSTCSWAKLQANPLGTLPPLGPPPLVRNPKSDMLGEKLTTSRKILRKHYYNGWRKKVK